MFCPNCGQQVPDGDKFCFSCGESMPAPQQPTPTPPVVEPTPAEPAPNPVPTFERAPSVVPGTETAEPPRPVVPTPPPAPAAKPKKKNGALIAIAVILVLALVAVGGWFAWQHFAPDQDEDTNTTTAATTVATEPSAATKPTEPPTAKVDLTAEDAQLVYEMTDADVDKFYELLAQCEELALGGQDSDTVMEVSDALDDHFEYMDGQHTIAMVLYYCDLNDEEASQLFLDCTDTVTQANNDYIEMAKKLYDADFPAKEAFFEEWTEQDLAMLVAYTPEVMELQQRNSEIEVAYQDMQDSATMYEDMVPLYIEMVQNNNRIAQIYGYDNYYSYAYDLVYTRDYGSDEIAQLRSYISGYMPEAISGAMNRFTTSMEDLSMVKQMNLSAFLFNSYQTAYEDDIAKYLQSLPEDTRNHMQDMFKGNILLMDEASSAREGAFTTTIGEDRSICFFGPGYSNPLTIVHELGHYYGSKYVSLNDMPLDLAETQSQSNEWLFLAYLSDKMSSKDLHTALVDYKMYSDMATIMLCVIIDDFEEQVYTHPDVASLTSDDLDAIMEEVCEKYGGIDFLDTNVTDVQTYWRMVVVEQPVYYISYGVSALAAINLYTVAQDDYQEAVEIYCGLIEDVDLESGFLGNISAAGLDGPFDEDVYRELSDIYAN